MPKTTQKAITLVNVSGIFSKITSNAKTIGQLYGYLSPMAATTPGDALGGIVAEHTQLLSGFKIPTLDRLRSEFNNWTRPAMETAIMAYVGGELVKIVNGKYGGALKKAGEGMFTGALAATIVMACGGGTNIGLYNPEAQQRMFNRTVQTPNRSAYPY